MRAKQLILLALCIPIASVLLLRHHIRDLFEVARTYSTFHAYINSHTDVLFRYPPSNPSTSQKEPIALPQPVPTIIHQIFLSQGRPGSSLAKYETAIESCKALHPSWEFRMWNDEDAVRFMRQHYPEILPHFVGYRQNIQRANILRYALLHHYGGVYIDLDVTCRVALDAKLPNGSAVDTLTQLPWLTPGAYPAGVNNAFILSRAGHPFLEELLARTPSRDLWWPMPYVENMLSTGCMFFSNVWTAYALRLKSVAKQGGEVPKEDRIYVLADEHGGMEAHMLRGKITTPLLEHGGASSWHGWDAQAIVLIGKHYGYFASGFAVLIVGFVLLVWKLANCNGPRKRGSWRAGRISIDRKSTDKYRGSIDEEQAIMKDG
jgi:mannosyltransferase OCH1-like enzyme